LSEPLYIPKRVLVIDDDRVFCKQVETYLAELGVSSVDVVHDGKEGWERLRTSAYEALILDWKIPSLSGLALFNRIRQTANMRTMPLLVVSGLINREDFRLLHEFPCTALLEKPFTKALFEKKFTELFGQAVWFAENTELIDQLSEAVLADTKKAMDLLKTVLNQAPQPLPIVGMGIRRLRARGELGPAETLARKVLEVDPRNVMALMELGKILTVRGKHLDALAVLQSANELSPNNLGRLCLMGEVELNLCEPSRAKEYFQQALEIDPAHPKAKAGSELSSDMNSIIETPENDHVPRTFASLLNVMGINMVRTGDFKRGIARYTNAMKFLHVNDTAARVAYNLGLGYLRWGKPEEALKWFVKSEKMGQGTFNRSRGWIAKLQLQTGERTPTAAEDLESISVKEPRQKPKLDATDLEPIDLPPADIVLAAEEEEGIQVGGIRP
jgi:CheY-like chemotaxis protein